MRKLFFSILMLVSLVAGAQNTKPFKVNVAAGYGATADYSNSNAITKAGFVYSIEPLYRIVNNIDVGLRFEQAFIQRPEFIDKVVVFQTNAKSISSAVVTANYTIRIGSQFQPYIGVGGGLYHTDPSTQTRPSPSGNSTVSYPLPATNVAGGVARVGLKWGRVNVVADYNVVSDTRVTVSATNLTLEAKNSYFSIKAGFTIGGGSDK